MMSFAPGDLPAVRGKLLLNEELAPFTWFRVGGPADALFLPADEDDVRDFLRALPISVPVTVIGVGSNVIVRDGGIEGVVIRLAGRRFSEVVVDKETAAAPEARVVAGAGALDSLVARTAAKAGIEGLEFFAGIPGTIGGALTMNAGCYGRETKDVLESAWGFDRSGEAHTLGVDAFGFSYRRHALPQQMIWMQAVFSGVRSTPEAVQASITRITEQREATQPIREKTGGSTFKNPPGESAWRLVDQAGMRGARRGGAQVSEKHANFLINTGDARAADVEGLGEEVRAAVKRSSGIELEWEIKRIGR
jgi:UDP-N-acetylmuramate dehydrogenase